MPNLIEIPLNSGDKFSVSHELEYDENGNPLITLCGQGTLTLLDTPDGRWAVSIRGAARELVATVEVENDPLVAQVVALARLIEPSLELESGALYAAQGKAMKIQKLLQDLMVAVQTAGGGNK